MNINVDEMVDRFRNEADHLIMYAIVKHGCIPPSDNKGKNLTY